MKQFKDRSKLVRATITAVIKKAPVVSAGGGVSVPPLFNLLPWGGFAFSAWTAGGGSGSGVTITPIGKAVLLRDRVIGSFERQP